MTVKTIYMLNIDDYAPELRAVCRPTVEAYAERIGARIHDITERITRWPVTYEKLQIYGLSRQNGDDWSIYVDSDVCIHPELPDVTEIVPPDSVAHNANDWSPVRFDPDDYMRRDGRWIGSCNWLAIAPACCRDLWRPLDIPLERALERIHPTVAEVAAGIAPEHLIDDFALSNNIARFGLKFSPLRKLWEQHGLVLPDFFFHEYVYPVEDYTVVQDGTEVTLPGKITRARDTLKRWGIGS